MKVADKEKISRINEALAYIASKAHDNKSNFYNVLKVFYLADKLHMERYGRFIFDEQYAAMEKGPVPSIAYDVIKKIKGEDAFNKDIDISEVSFSVSLSGYNIIPSRKANLDYFSNSDIECINEIIMKSNKEDLGDLSHDEAWKNTKRNTIMDPEAIISSLENKEDLLDLYKNRHQ